jgi:hypothetical protein
MMPPASESVGIMSKEQSLMEAVAQAVVESYQTAGLSPDTSSDEASLLCKLSSIAAAAAAAAVQQAFLHRLNCAACVVMRYLVSG